MTYMFEQTADSFTNEEKMTEWQSIKTAPKINGFWLTNLTGHMAALNLKAVTALCAAGLMMINFGMAKHQTALKLQNWKMWS